MEWAGDIDTHEQAKLSRFAVWGVHKNGGCELTLHRSGYRLKPFQHLPEHAKKSEGLCTSRNNNEYALNYLKLLQRLSLVRRNEHVCQTCMWAHKHRKKHCHCSRLSMAEHTSSSQRTWGSSWDASLAEMLKKEGSNWSWSLTKPARLTY